MKTVELSSEALSATALLDMARENSIPVETAVGDAFMVSPADEFAV
ncbi:hypothetical protein FJY63_07230, partial [Candidatus Sumerlaeota bacterium]|nr:hypothetical protein [Candidatus Sumerlaeota bacterium]